MASKSKKSRERQERKPEELEAAGKHVGYEIEMLSYSALRLGVGHSSPMTTLEDNEKNLALEGFLLHYRNLRSFLCPGSEPWTDDIVASDFLGSGELSDVGDSATIGQHKDRLDKMLAHLSYTRETYIEAKDYGWQTAQMTVVLLDQLEMFLAKLPADRRDWFPVAERISSHKAAASALAKTAAVLDQTTISIISTSRLGPQRRESGDAPAVE